MNHNDVAEHIFSTAGEKDNGSEGKDTLLYSCVRMCARKEKREKREKEKRSEKKESTNE
ncbi:hypothetical protein [Bacteroides difficilis]|uniref:hypothetical protein n=1 Tax=Bacteroides difficilis TaxID=2763021 RepID=UPI003AABAD2A